MFVQSVRLLTLFCFIATYSTISDEQLDELVREAQSRNPNTGIRLTKGFVMELSIYVSVTKATARAVRGS